LILAGLNVSRIKVVFAGGAALTAVSLVYSRNLDRRDRALAGM